MAVEELEDQENNQQEIEQTEIDRKSELDTKASEDKVEDRSELLKQLMDAAKSGDSELVKNLVTKQNVDVNSFDDRGQTALHYASVYRKINVIKILLQLRADATMQEKITGMTPLILSISYNDINAVNELLESNGDCYKIKTYSGISPLEKAAHKMELYENWKMVKILLQQHKKLYEEKDIKFAQTIKDAFYRAVDMEEEAYSHGDKYVELVNELGVSDLLLDN